MVRNRCYKIVKCQKKCQESWLHLANPARPFLVKLPFFFLQFFHWAFWGQMTTFPSTYQKFFRLESFCAAVIKMKNCNPPWNTKNENGSRHMPVASPLGPNCSENFGYCWWCDRPTSLQVQTKVEERSISKSTEQIVAAFESGHQDWARDDLWGRTQRKMIYFSLTVESQVQGWTAQW